MICCENCFNDAEIKAIIKNRVKTRGNCGACNSDNVFIYDTNVDDELVNSLNNLLNVYTTKESLPDDFLKEDLTTLEYELTQRWSIFAKGKHKALDIIKAICAERFKENPALFEDEIGIYDINNVAYLEENSLLKSSNWNTFVNEIKMSNRFHTNIMNLEILYEFCRETAEIEIKKGSEFYRSRISDRQGYTKTEMGAPPIHKITNGRANPVGIKCLYLSSNEETTLHEIRAGAFDYVTIGTFRALEDIIIVDFTVLDKISPLMVEDIKRYAVNKRHLEQIIDEIAQPLRSTDSPLDYLPSQYIVEFIKSKGYKGVKYKSTVSNTGYNLAIFDDALFETFDTKVVTIDKMKYSYSSVNE